MLDRPIATTVLVLAILLLGGLSLKRLPPALWPEWTVPELVVTTRLAFAPAEDVERRITEPLEPLIAGVPGVERLESVSGYGVSRTMVTFSWETDMDMAYLELRKRLDEGRALLPPTASRPSVQPPPDPAGKVALIAVQVAESGDDAPQESFLWADGVLARRLEAEPGIARAVLAGGLKRDVEVVVSEGAMRRLGLTLERVIGGLRGLGQGRPIGRLEASGFRYSVRLEEPERSLADLEGRILDSDALGSPVRLGEVAEVSLRAHDLPPVTLLDGRRVALLEVYKTRDSGSLEASRQLRLVLAELADRYPDVRAEVVREQAVKTRALLDELLWTLAAGAVLAVLVLVAFLRDGASPIGIGLAIPVSLAMTFVLLDLTGIPLTVLSLFGLVLGAGLLLDNAIVVMENVSRLRRDGHSAREAARLGVREVRTPVIASTLTTLAVFLPLWLVGGYHGALFKDLVVSLGVSLTASLFTALVVLPAFLARFSRAGGGGAMTHWSGRAGGGDVGIGGGQGGESGVVPGDGGGSARRPDWGISWVERLPDMLRIRPRRLAAIAAVCAAGSVLAFRDLPKGVFPEQTPDSIWVRVDPGGNAGLEHGVQLAGMLTEEIARETGIRSVLAWIGMEGASGGAGALGGGGAMGPSSLPAGEEPAHARQGGMFANSVFLSIPISSRAQPLSVQAVLERFESQWPEWSVESGASDLADGIRLVRSSGNGVDGDSAGRGGRAGAVRFTVGAQSRGREGAMAAALSEHLRLAGLPVRLEPVSEQSRRALDVRLRPEAAAGYGLDPESVLRTAQAGMGGVGVATWDHGDGRAAVNVRLVDAVGGVPMAGLGVGAGAVPIPLGSLIETIGTTRPTELLRIGQLPARVFDTDLTVRDWMRDGARIEVLTEAFSRDAGEPVFIGGPGPEALDLMRNVGGLLALSTLLMYLVLCVQFESLLAPVLILLSVPFALTGAFIGLWLAGEGVNVFSGMGMLLLVGIAVNDAILKMDVMGRLVAGGLAVPCAVREAGRLRARPVVMTTATTVLSLFPMLLDAGAGGSMKRSLAVAVMGGMVSSTWLTLGLLPEIYRWVHTRRGGGGRFAGWSGGKFGGWPGRLRARVRGGLRGVGCVRGVVLAVGVVAGTAGCGGPEAGTGRDEEGGVERVAAVHPDVVFAVADSGALPSWVEGAGLVEPQRAFPVVGAVGGVVRGHRVVDGFAVQAGDTLLEFDSREWILAEQRARALYWLKLREFQIESDYPAQEGMGSGASIGEECLPPERPVLAVSNGLAEACLQWHRARLDLERAVALAPFSGLMSSERSLMAGEWVAAGETLGWLLDPTGAQVRLQVLDSEREKIRAGQQVEVATPSGRTLRGVVERLSPRMDSKSRSSGVWVSLIDTLGALRPGMRVVGRVRTGMQSGGVRVPADAVLERNGKPMVFRLRGSQVEWVYVSRLAGDRRHVLLDAQDLRPGDTLAVEGHFSIRHQQQVNPILR